MEEISHFDAASVSSRTWTLVANEATELRSEVDSVANYNAAQCRQKLSNSA